MNLSAMAYGYATSQIIYAAVRLGLPELLAGRAVFFGDLVKDTGCDERSLQRLVRALVVLGVAREMAPGVLTLTPAGQPLRADHPRSMRSSVLLLGDPATWQAWGALTHSVRTGEAAWEHVHGKPLFDYLGGHPELSRVFNAAMREGTGWVAAELPKAHDFTGVGTVVDVGGGNGALLSAVMAAAPGVRGILFDTAEGVGEAAGPFHVVTGDFFAAVPSGDVMLLKGVLHDWDDERCAAILRNCRTSIARDGRLLVLEPVLGSRPDAGAVMSDLAMLVYTGGWERTRAEFEELLEGAGFVLTEVTAPLAGSATRVLVAVPG